VSEDWAAVAAAVDARVRELGWRQRELSERSHVSQATVREIQHHVVERRRSARTLEALSTTLGWPPRHLHDVLRGDDAAIPSRPMTRSDTAGFNSRLERLEHQLTEITGRLDDIHTELKAVVDHIRASG
jgi:hypothetical protein